MKLVKLKKGRRKIGINTLVPVGGKSIIDDYKKIEDLAIGVYDVSSMPTEVGPTYWTIYVNITSITADLDLTSWLPTGIQEGATVIIRKMDTSPYKITFEEFTHVDRKLESLTLQWDGTQFLAK